MDANGFLNLLFGHPSLAGLYIPLWFKGRNGHAEHRTWPVSQLAEAAAAADAESLTSDVYVRTTPIGFMPAGDKRGLSADARALVALCADIDVQGEGHAKTALPPDPTAAFDLAYECAKPPSLIVGSGGGLHVWWVFREPFLITDDATLKEAQAMALGWGAHIKAKGEAHGWKLDTVSDLSRVLRIPGTKNHKTEAPRPVEVMACRK